MAINAWKTTFVGINKPAKVVVGTADSFTPAAYWPYANGAEDPYWSGGINPQPYRWTVTFTITESFHGSHLTRTPFRFNANDIDVGDFVAGADDGKVCEIMSILAKDDFSLTAIVEDRLRYNTFRSATGDGLFSCPGNVIFFQINEIGHPMIDPVPSTAGSTFADNVVSRFQYMNPLTNYILEAENHSFEKGDAVCIENGEFVRSNADNIGKFIGTVVHAGPGPNYFILRPANGIIDFVPNLPGDIGDYIYPSIDGTGDLTTNDASRRPIFLKIDNARETFTIGNNINAAGLAGDIISVNGTGINLGVATLDQAITAINASTAQHKITASKVNASVSMTTDTADLALGVIAGVVPFTAIINGVSINFTTTASGNITFGSPIYADVTDIANDINAAAIPNVVAAVNQQGNLVLTHLVGGAISIVNQGVQKFAGDNSISGLPLSIPANTTTWVLKLSDPNGGPMTLRDLQGTFFSTAGVISGQNGRYATGLNIEQGLRTSATIVVADIAARDALHPLVGDQAYVINAGNGEWAIYLWNGSAWTRFQNQRSEATDARTIEYTATLPGTTATIGAVTAGRRILNVTVAVLSTLSNIGEFAVKVGSTAVWEYTKHGGNQVGSYSVESDLITSARENVLVEFPANTASGTIRIEVTYL